MSFRLNKEKGNVMRGRESSELRCHFFDGAGASGIDGRRLVVQLITGPMRELSFNVIVVIKL